MAQSKVVVGRADDFKDGERVTVDIGNDKQVVVFRQDGSFYGLLNHCPHRGAPLCKGRFVANITSDRVGEYVFHGEKRLLACPWHGWEFDIQTGQSYFDPVGTRARPFAVEVEYGASVQAEVASGQASFTPPEYVAHVDVTDGGLRPGPYQAESFHVVVEDRYVVILLRPARPARPGRPARPLKSEATE